MILKAATLSLVLQLGAPEIQAASPEILVDTDFSKSPAGGDLIIGNASPPLENPDAVVPAKPSASSIVAGKETVGALRPPYALFTIGARADNSALLENASLKWNLVSLGLLSGIYELTATVTALEGDVFGGRLLVGLGAEGGKPFPSGQGVHPSQWPLHFYFAGGKMFLGNKSAPLTMGEPCQIKMRFDLDKRVWSGWINGEELVTDFSFPPPLADTSAPIQVTNLTFGSLAGMGDKPGASYAIAGVKLVKVGN